MKLGKAGRFPRSGECELGHYLYILEDGSDWCVLLCETYEFAFSAGWGATGSALCGELFSHAWSAVSSAAAPERLDAAATAMGDGFCERAPSIWPVGPDPLDGGAMLIFLAAARQNDGAIHLRWIGDQICVLVRARTPVRWTISHTLHNVLVREGRAPEQIPAGHVIARTISSDQSPELRVPEAALWSDVARGDHLIIASGDLAQHATLSDVAAMCEPGAAPSVLAERIVALIAQRGDPFGVAVCVVAL